jgi:hypothetical protein
MNNLIEKHKVLIDQVCRKYKVEKLYVFGSFATHEFNKESDIDFLISFMKDITIEEYAENYFILHYWLEELFQRPIDLITENSLSNPYFIESVNRNKKLIYAA